MRFYVERSDKVYFGVRDARAVRYDGVAEVRDPALAQCIADMLNAEPREYLPLNPPS